MEGKCQEDWGHPQREAGEKFKEQKAVHKLICRGNGSRGVPKSRKVWRGIVNSVGVIYILL